jgi:hypothetical protein
MIRHRKIYYVYKVFEELCISKTGITQTHRPSIVSNTCSCNPIQGIEYDPLCSYYGHKSSTHPAHGDFRPPLVSFTERSTHTVSQLSRDGQPSTLCVCPLCPFGWPRSASEFPDKHVGCRTARALTGTLCGAKSCVDIEHPLVWTQC